MKIHLTKTGKRFNRDWIFKNFDYIFLQGGHYAITGNNGSGKSTLLQILAGNMDPSEGEIIRTINDTQVDPEVCYKYLSIAAPYLDIVEEMTALEFLQFHNRFKPLLSISIEEILQLTGLEKAASKQIRYYSSGMKQRLKLAQAIFSNVPLLLLDEPCTNLDAAGYDLYNRLITQYAQHKTIIISSNDVHEYSFCDHVISMGDYK